MLRAHDLATHSNPCRRPAARTATLDRGLRVSAENLALYLLVCLVWGTVLYLAVTQAL